MEASDADFASLLASFRSSPSDDELTFEIPAAWLEPASEAALWAHCARESAFELELRLTSALLTKLLGPEQVHERFHLRAWPSRDRHQLWATLWLACRLVPGRAYARDELTALLVRRSDVELATPALLASMLADVERRGPHRACRNRLCAFDRQAQVRPRRRQIIRAARVRQRPSVVAAAAAGAVRCRAALRRAAAGGDDLSLRAPRRGGRRDRVDHRALRGGRRRGARRECERLVGRAGRALRGAAGAVRGADALPLRRGARGDGGGARAAVCRRLQRGRRRRLGAAPRPADAVRRGDWERRPRRRARRAAVRRPRRGAARARERAARGAAARRRRRRQAVADEAEAAGGRRPLARPSSWCAIDRTPSSRSTG